METKKCSRCGKEFPLKEFTNNGKKGNTRKTSACKKCETKRVKAYYYKNKEAISAKRKEKYKVSKENNS